MRCRFCAGEKPDELRPIPSLRKALKGIQAEFLIYHCPKRFGQVAGPSVAAIDPQRAKLDEEWAVIDFAAVQCVRYTHVKNEWQVTVHPCFEKDKTLFLATGDRTKPDDVEDFADFFKRVMRDGETRGRKGALTLEQMLNAQRRLGKWSGWQRLATALSVEARSAQQVLKNSGLTLDEFKRLASGQTQKTVTVPVEGSQVRREDSYWAQTDEGELVLIEPPGSDDEKAKE
jgi:hypothetical protein